MMEEDGVPRSRSFSTSPVNNKNRSDKNDGSGTPSSSSSPRNNGGMRRREQQQVPPRLPTRTRSFSPHQRVPPRMRSGQGLPVPVASKWNFCSGKSHLFVLFTGMMLGYLLLPVLLIEVQLTDFMDRFPDPQANHPVVREQNYFLRQTESRSLDGAPPAVGAMGGAVKNALQEEHTLPSHVEQRLIEDHDVLSRQSMPTATTPYIMKTKILPDHHRLKILVTGGAGFVGSHLVDKLMMEGHEVIVVDNFFTGQKKNIAHWLHHPLFR